MVRIVKYTNIQTLKTKFSVQSNRIFGFIPWFWHTMKDSKRQSNAKIKGLTYEDAAFDNFTDAHIFAIEHSNKIEKRVIATY